MWATGYAIFLNGGYGVGKSAVLEHVGDLFADLARPFSLMDIDWFHRSWPPGDNDPDNVLTEADNMAAVWTNYRQAGPRQLVIAGVIATGGDRERYQRALGLSVRSIRLEATPAVTEERLHRRYTAEQKQTLAWHLSRYQELARQLKMVNQDELAIPTDDQTPRATAERVLEHFEFYQNG